MGPDQFPRTNRPQLQPPTTLPSRQPTPTATTDKAIGSPAGTMILGTPRVTGDGPRRGVAVTNSRRVFPPRQRPQACSRYASRVAPAITSTPAAEQHAIPRQRECLDHPQLLQPPHPQHPATAGVIRRQGHPAESCRSSRPRHSEVVSVCSSNARVGRPCLLPRASGDGSACAKFQRNDNQGRSGPDGSPTPQKRG